MTGITARLDRLPFSRFHRRLLTIGGCGYMFDALDVGIIAFLLPALKVEWGLTAPQLGLLAAGASIGGIPGALIAGILGDLIGRKAVMMWSLAINCVASLGCAVSSSWEVFLAFRIIAGIGCSAESAIIAPYLAEFAGPSFRGRYIGSLTGFFSFGYLLAAAIGYLIVPIDPWAWRYALALAALPIVMLLWWRRSLPESPRWLETRGKRAEADTILGRIEAEVAASGATLLPFKSEDMITVGSAEPMIIKNHWRPITMALLAWFSIGFSYYAFFSWMPSLLIERGMDISRSFGFSIAIYAAQVPGYFIAAWLNDAIGRKMVVTSYMFCGGLAAAMLAIAPTTETVLAAAIALSFFMNGTYAGIYTYTAELFPTRARARMQGITGAASRVGAVISPIAVGYIYPTFGFLAVFGLTSAMLLAGMIAVLVFGLQTLGRTLEQIGERRT